MRQLKNLAPFLYLLLIFSTSCSSSLEKDAEKIATLKCKAQHLIQKTIDGDTTALPKSIQLLKRAQNEEDAIQQRYSNIEGQKQFTEALMQALNKCR